MHARYNITSIDFMTMVEIENLLCVHEPASTLVLTRPQSYSTVQKCVTDQRAEQTRQHAGELGHGQAVQATALCDNYGML